MPYSVQNQPANMVFLLILVSLFKVCARKGIKSTVIIILLLICAIVTVIGLAGNSANTSQGSILLSISKGQIVYPLRAVLIQRISSHSKQLETYGEDD